MNRLRTTCLAIVWVLLLAVTGHGAEVQDVRVSQEGDTVVLTYNLVARGSEHRDGVQVWVSEDNGRQWRQLKGVSGDIGADVAVGAAKRIEWQVLADFPQGVDSELQFQVKTAGQDKARLYVKATPPDARIRVMNIEQRFSQGMELSAGAYELLVAAPGYDSYRESIVLKNDGGSLSVFDLSEQFHIASRPPFCQARPGVVERS